MSSPSSALEHRSPLTKRRVLGALCALLIATGVPTGLLLRPKISIEMPDSALDASMNQAADFVVANRGVLPVYSVVLRLYVRHYEGRSLEYGISKADDFEVGPQPIVDVLRPHQHVRASMPFFSIGNIKKADVTVLLSYQPGPAWNPWYMCMRFANGVDPLTGRATWSRQVSLQGCESLWADMKNKKALPPGMLTIPSRPVSRSNLLQ